MAEIQNGGHGPPYLAGAKTQRGDKLMKNEQ